MYLQAWLNPETPRAISALSRRLGVPRRTIYNWLADEAFVAWFDAEVQRHTDSLWRPVLLKVAQLALEGSIEHARLFAAVRDRAQSHRGHANGTVTVVLGVPRPMVSREPNE